VPPIGRDPEMPVGARNAFLRLSAVGWWCGKPRSPPWPGAVAVGRGPGVRGPALGVPDPLKNRGPPGRRPPALNPRRKDR